MSNHTQIKHIVSIFFVLIMLLQLSSVIGVYSAGSNDEISMSKVQIEEECEEKFTFSPLRNHQDNFTSSQGLTTAPSQASSDPYEVVLELNTPPPRI